MLLIIISRLLVRTFREENVCARVCVRVYVRERKRERESVKEREIAVWLRKRSKLLQRETA